jgi:hypothetical protein
MQPKKDVFDDATVFVSIVMNKLCIFWERSAPVTASSLFSAGSTLTAQTLLGDLHLGVQGSAASGEESGVSIYTNPASSSQIHGLKPSLRVFKNATIASSSSPVKPRFPSSSLFTVASTSGGGQQPAAKASASV